MEGAGRVLLVILVILVILLFLALLVTAGPPLERLLDWMLDPRRRRTPRTRPRLRG